MTKKCPDDIVATPNRRGGEKIAGVAVTILLMASSVSDLKDYRIPNYLILSGWLSGLAFRLYQGGIPAMGDGIFCITVSILSLMPLYFLRGIGAGDVKLLSVISGFYGLMFWLKTGIIFLFLAGAASVVRIIRKKIFWKRIHFFIYYVFHKRSGPYYDLKRDGREMVIPMAPLLLMAYYFVCMGGGDMF